MATIRYAVIRVDADDSFQTEALLNLVNGFHYSRAGEPMYFFDAELLDADPRQPSEGLVTAMKALRDPIAFCHALDCEDQTTHTFRFCECGVRDSKETLERELAALGGGS